MLKKISFKNILVLSSSVILLFLMTGCSAYEMQSNTTGDNQQTYNIDELNSYGDWVYVSPYGEVWRPYAVADWAPFDNGHWSYLNDNWTWVSYEPFGWIVYHYGYWYYDQFYGWVWIPSDNPWMPANVEWLNYDNYVCWAPLPPRGIKYRNPWDDGESSYHPWHVVRSRDFTEGNIHNYILNRPPARDRTDEISITRDAPGRTFVERSTGRNIPDMRTKKETIKFPKRQLQRMVLPDRERERVNENSSRVRERVLINRDEFRRQHPEKRR
jgi:hypothetical protein